MDITFTLNPYDSDRKIVSVIEQPRVAKLNNKVKRPVLQKHYEEELAKMQAIVQNVPEHKSIVDVRNERADLTVNNKEFQEVLYPINGNNIGARKLKVNETVRDKTSRSYNKALESLKRIEPSVSTPVFEPPVEQVVTIAQPVVEQPAVSIPEPVTPPVIDNSRVSRLYRTTEVPIEEVKRPVNDVINTPARFGGESNPLYEAAHALINDEPVNTPVTSKIEVGEEGKKLDHINAVSHGNPEFDAISNETAKLQEELSVIRERNKELDNKIIDIEQIYAATERRIKEKETALKKNELLKAKRAYRQAEEEKLSKTNTYKDLAGKLRELQLREAQIDQLANSGDDYSQGMSRAA